MNDHIRIIVTGSRLWRDTEVLFNALDDLTVEYRNVTIVHGMCDPRLPRGEGFQVIPWDEACSVAHLPVAQNFLGADWWADRHAKRRGWNTVGVPANWKGGVQAGPRRNRAMISQGADFVLGFPQGDSKGTRGCLKMAIEAAIPVRTFEGALLDLPEPTPGTD